MSAMVTNVLHCSDVMVNVSWFWIFFVKKETERLNNEGAFFYF